MGKFIAALDQSGGSTPGALKRYGVTRYTEDTMLDEIHHMRMRIMNSKMFTSDHIDGAILFEDTVKRGGCTPLVRKGIKPFLKVDKGLNDDGTMKDFDLDVLDEYNACGIYGTKMRSVVHVPEMIETVIKQQLEYANKVLEYGLIPIVEPEIDISNPDKSQIEVLLADELLKQLDNVNGRIILKLTIPNSDVYTDVNDHSNVSKIVALSGGYSLDVATKKLAKIDNMSASFSRALTEHIYVNQPDYVFDVELGYNIKKIFEAS